MKRILPGLLLLAGVSSLAGCAQRAPRVGLLTPGPVSDRGWNAAAYEGLQRIAAELHVPVGHVEVKTPSEFEEQFRDFASHGAWLVIGHGFEFQDAAARVAPDFPKTVFLTTSGSTVRKNVAPLVFELEQATYLCGLIAGRLSKSGTIGAVGGLEIPSVASTFLAFEAGVHAASPADRVRIVYTGSFDDPAAARQATLALADQGCDFVIQNADAAGAGVFQAAKERGLYVFGTNKDQAALAPANVVASAVIDIPKAFVQVARQVREGRFEARPIRFGLRDGVISLVWNRSFPHPVPAAVTAEVEGARREITEGRLAVPRGNF